MRKLERLRKQLNEATENVLPTERAAAQQKAHEEYYYALAEELGYTTNEYSGVVNEEGVVVNISMMETELERRARNG